jgi:hypothetical protein
MHAMWRGEITIRHRQHLHRDNSFVVFGRITNDMGEVAVQGQQNGVDFLSLRNYDGVR